MEMDLTITDIAVRMVLGLVIGFSIGATGIGGGVLVVPSLSLLLGLPTTVCVGTASLYTFVAKAFAAYRHAKLKTIDWSISIMILAGAIPGSIAAAFIVNKNVVASGKEAASVQSFQDNMKIFIAAVILVMAVLLLVNLVGKLRVKHAGEKTGHAVKLDSCPWLKRCIALLFGLLVGTLLGSTSVGGGVIIISGMILFFGLSTKRAVGSSLFVGVALTFVTSIIYFANNQLDYVTALIMAAASLAGVYFGSNLSVKIPDRILRGTIVMLIIIAAVLMLAG